MSRTPPTIVAPLPDDPRVFALAKASGLTTREAFAAAAECWAWVHVRAVDDIVANTPPEYLDAVVDVPGFGPAMVQAGLVGTVDNGLVLPAELRRLAGGQRGGRAAADAEHKEDKVERERKQARIRQRRRRAEKALTKPASKDTSPVPAAGAAPPKRTIRRLGTVDGFPVMLLWNRDGDPFYVLKGSSPKEFTGTVTDQDSPSYADALVALHAAMKREGSKGLGSADTFRPSLSAVVAAAERYRADRASAAADVARRAEANRAAAEAAAEDQDHAVDEPAERDSHAHVTHDERDSVTVTEVSRQNSVTCPPNSSDDEDFRSVTCHGPVTEPAPSSSSSSAAPVSSEQVSKETTTTTSSVTSAERDHEDRILDRILVAGPSRQGDGPWHDDDPAAAQQRRRHEERLERIAAALGDDIDKVRIRNSDYLEFQCREAGIDFRTGHPVNAGAPDEPAGARDDIGATMKASTGDTPAAGNVGARGGASLTTKNFLTFSVFGSHATRSGRRVTRA